MSPEICFIKVNSDAVAVGPIFCALHHWAGELLAFRRWELIETWNRAPLEPVTGVVLSHVSSILCFYFATRNAIISLCLGALLLGSWMLRATAEQQRWKELVVPAGYRGNCTSLVWLGVVAFWAGVALGTHFFLHISLAKRMRVVSLLLLPFPIKTSACVLTVGKRTKMTNARFLGEFSRLHQTEECIPLKVWLQ